MCIFCDIVSGQAPASVVCRRGEFLAFMDIYPWRPGHVLVIPTSHYQHVHEMDMARRRDLFALGSQIAEALRACDIDCDDLHFLINDGRAANQTVAHVHLHVLPRRRGDLWRLVRALGMRPFISILGPTSRAVLDRHAAEIRRHLDESPPHDVVD